MFDGSVDSENDDSALLPEAEKLIDDHEEGRRIKEKPETPEIVEEDGSSAPTTVCRASSTSGTTPLATITNSRVSHVSINGNRPPPPIHRPIDITGTLEENKALKSEVFALKTEIFTLRRELPVIKNTDGIDITDEFIKCREQLIDEKDLRSRLENELEEIRKEYSKLKKTHDREKITWIAEKEQLVTDRNSMRVQLEKVTSELHQVQQCLLDYKCSPGRGEDGNVSQAESSFSNFSILSERDQKIDELNGRLLRMTAEEESRRKKMEKETNELRTKLSEKTAELNLLADAAKSEKLRFEETRAELSQVQLKLKDQLQNFEEFKKTHDEQVAGYEAQLTKYFKAINALVSKQRGDSTARSYEVRYGEENEFDKESASRSDENSAASSIWDHERIELENRKADERLKAELYDDNLSSDCRKELKEKMAAFDALLPSFRSEGDDDLRISSARKPITPLNVQRLDITSVADASLNATYGLNEKLNVYKGMCDSLFKKLQGSAAFLQSLLEQMQSGELGREIADMINGLRLDLDKSMNATTEVMGLLEVTQRSMVEYVECAGEVERSVRSMSLISARGIVEVAVDSEKADLVEKLSKMEQELLETKANLDAARAELDEKEANFMKALEEKNIQLETAFADLTKVKELRMEGALQLDRMKEDVKNRYEQMVADLACLKKEDVHKDELIKEKDALIEQMDRSLNDKMQEISEYKQQLQTAEMKAQELIGTVRNTMNSIPDRVVEAVAGSMNERHSSEALDLLGAQIKRMDEHIGELRTELTKLHGMLEHCESCRDQAEANCRELLEEKHGLEEEVGELRSKLASDEQRMQAKMSVLEAELRMVTADRDNHKQNADRLCSTIAEMEENTEELRLKLANSQKRPVKEDVKGNFHWKTVTAMTLMSGEDIVLMEQKVKHLNAFARSMYEHAARSSKHPPNTTKTAFTEADLKRLSERIIRMDKLLEEEIEKLTRQVKENNAKLVERLAEYEESFRQHGNKEILPGESRQGSVSPCASEATNASFKALVAEPELLACIGNVVTSQGIKEMHEIADHIVQQLKVLFAGQGDDKKNILTKARTLRSRLVAVYQKMVAYEAAKENVGVTGQSMEHLKETNLRLQLELDESKTLLQKAHEKLSPVPNNAAMCEQIVRELCKIEEVMKAATTAFDSIRSRRKIKGNEKGGKQ